MSNTMLSRLRKRNGTWGIGLWLALTLAILARVIAPHVAAPERDGYIAICSGSEILYLPIAQFSDAAPADHGDDGAGHEPDRIPCLWLGQYLAILPWIAALVVLGVRPRPPAETRRHQLRAQGAAKPFHSQGPPQVSA